eukprot:INCI11122.1.p1 GENE.INCI11122.1~~INCI11122.1.p1  ORF type:complete len:281 (+),score=31.29 INCI11122.1:175-1017(+)
MRVACLNDESRPKTPNFDGESLWEVNVTNIDTELWMSPEEVTDFRENQCDSIAVKLGVGGKAGFGVRRRKTSRDFLDNDVVVDKFNRTPDGSRFHAELAGVLKVGDVIKFVNGHFVTGLKSFVKMMRAEGQIALTKSQPEDHCVVLGIERMVCRTVSPTRADQRKARQNKVDVSAAWGELRRARPSLPEAPPTPRARCGTERSMPMSPDSVTMPIVATKPSSRQAAQWAPSTPIVPLRLDLGASRLRRKRRGSTSNVMAALVEDSQSMRPLTSPKRRLLR